MPHKYNQFVQKCLRNNHFEMCKKTKCAYKFLQISTNVTGCFVNLVRLRLNTTKLNYVSYLNRILDNNIKINVKNH